MASLTASRIWNLTRWSLVPAALVAAVAVQAVPAGSAEEIRERTRPVGQVCRAGESCGGVAAPAVAAAPQQAATDSAVAGGGMTGEQVYKQSCFACHATGVSNAPKLADAGAWSARIAKGMDALLASTINGVNLMPPRGTCMSCSDDELRAAVEYLVKSAQ